MEESKKLKKLKKENRKLLKELSELRRDFIGIEKKVKKLKRDDRKRKRKEKKDKDKGPTKKLPKLDDSGLKSLQSPKMATSDGPLKKVKVRNPFTKSNNKITVTDASPKNNKYLYKLFTDYRNAPEGSDKKAEMRRGLTQIVSGAMMQGVLEFEKGCIPAEIMDDAIALYKSRTGNNVVIMSDSSTSPTSESESEGPAPVNTFQGNMEHYRIEFQGEERTKGFIQALTGATERFEAILAKSLKRHGAFRFYADYTVLMGRGLTVDPQDSNKTRYTEEREVKLSSNGEGGGMIHVTKKADLYSAPSNVFQDLTDAVSDYNELGSGFVYIASVALDIYISKQVYGTKVYRSPKRSDTPSSSDEPEKVGNWLPLPKWLTAKYAIVNPRPPNLSTDQHCFEWCILRAKHPFKGLQGGNVTAKDCRDIIQYQGKEVFLPPGVSYPIPLNDTVLRKIEEINDFTFSIFALGNEEGAIRPIYISECKAATKQHIHLGVLSSDDLHHFVLINRLSAIINQDKSRTCIHFCERCLSTHQTQEALDSHLMICGKHEPCRMKLPEPGSRDHFITFNSWHQLMPVPFVIYADFECILKPNDKGGHDHIPSCFCYHIKCTYDIHTIIKGYEDRPLGDIRVYTGKDCMKKFFESIFYDTKLMYDIIQYTYNPYSKRPGDLEALNQATVCHICRKELGIQRHLDHDHFTGLYRGAAHPTCNQHYTSKKMEYIPCVIHNLKGYDGYNILAYLHEIIDDVSKLEVIAKNLEKFTCMTINHIRFIDSIQFINGSLEAQVNNLRASIPQEDKSKYFLEVYKLSLTARKDLFEECMMKGVYPYEWVDSFEKMDVKTYPKKEHFYSSLTDESISDQEYNRGKEMWKYFDCKSMKDYTELYCKLDVLLLEALFETFRKACLSENGSRLDPAHFVTAPSLSWAAMLLMNYQNGIALENMTDMEMFLMVENGIRGGMCQVMHPYAKSRHNQESEESEGSSFTLRDKGTEILYLDANNLYGWAMDQLLPLGDYKWEYNPERIKNNRVLMAANKGKERQTIWECCTEEWAIEEILNLPDDSPKGYIMEVDIHFPSEVHDYFNDYPMCPEPKVPIPSVYTQAEMYRLGIFQSRSKTQKLVCDLEPRKKYVIHYRNLKQAMKHGVVLDKVHRVISFEQSDWLSRYILYNTEKRKLATNKIDQDFYKLMNNSIFGKTMEDFRKRRKIQFYTEKNIDKALKDVSSPWCKHWRIITDDKLMIMEMARHSITFTRPVIIGMAILELSKLHMFNFHYEVMKPTFGSNMRMLYTDTDSLVYELSDSDTEMVEEILVRMQKERNCFDLSEMKNKDHLLLKSGFDPKENEKKLGKMKDELGGHRVHEFVALRSKMYSFRMESEVIAGKNKAKGIPGKAVNDKTKKRICHDDYMRALEGGELESVTFNAICHDKTFRLQTKKISKVGLSACDDKSYYFDATSSLRYGHYMIGEREKEAEQNLKHLEALISDVSEDEADDEAQNIINYINNEMEIHSRAK